MRLLSFTFALATAFLAGIACRADVPRIVVEARALDENGQPIADGTHAAVFRVYAEPTDGQEIWSEALPAVSVADGRFRAELGRINPLSLDWSRTYYVSVQFDSLEPCRDRIALRAPGGRLPTAGAADGVAYVAADYPLYEPVGATCDESVHPGGNWGANIGSYEGVIAYSNGSDTGSWSSLEPYCQDGYEFQCVEYVRRFYRLHLGMNTVWYGNANQYYDNGPGWGLERYPNNGTSLPQPDDILCFNYGSVGHVAIVTSVTSNRVNVIQQNVSSTTAYGYCNITNGIVYGSTCQGWLRKPGNGDTTPPVISNVQASGISSTSATITWTTDDSSTSQVEYGLSSSYGMSTVEDTIVVTSHSVLVSGLSAGTTYHYRVKSTNGAGMTSYSGDYTFTTTPVVPGQPAVAVVNASSLSVTNNPGDSPTSYYAFRINDGSACSNKFVQSNGTVGSTPVWQTKSAWGTKTVTGLSPNTSYTFDVAAASSSSGSPATSNRYAGSYVNSPTLGVASKWGSGDTAAAFNGTSQFVSLPAMGPEVNLSSGFTIECWAKPSSLSTWYPVIQLTDSSAYGTFVNHICFDMSGTGGMRGEIYQSAGCGSPCYGNYYVSPSLSFTAGEWHHYAMVVSPGGTLTFYKDGVADAGQALLYMPSSGVTRGKVQIGRRDTTQTNYWPGSLDEVAVYSYALSSARINAHKNAPDAASYCTEVVKDNPVAYWRLGESSGSAAADSKGGYSPSATNTTPACTAPVAPTSASANPATICSGGSATLSASGGSGDVCRWYSGACGGTLVGSGTSIVVSPSSTTTYYARWETAGCGSSGCVSASVNVAPAPTVSSVNPPSGSNIGVTAVTNLAGAGFVSGMTARLTRAGYADIPAADVVVASPTKITCSFNLAGKKTGLWNLVVANPCGQQAVLNNGFGIALPPSAPVAGTTVRSLLDAAAAAAAVSRRFCVWGRVELIDGSSFWLDDGSGPRIKVYAPGYSGIANGGYAFAFGTVDAGTSPLVLVSSADQVR